MKPSFCASVFAFIIIGVLTIQERTFNTDILFIKTLIVGSICFPAIFYFYLNLAAEQTWPMKQEVNHNQTLTWVLTVIQYLCFFLLWAAASRQWHYYAALLVLIHFTYIVWDTLHSEQLDKGEEEHKDKVYLLRLSDFFGFFISLLLFFVAFFTPKDPTLEEATFVGFVAGCIIVSNIIFLCLAIRAFAYNPFRMLSPNGSQINSVDS